jgi:hypothetical protein
MAEFCDGHPNGKSDSTLWKNQDVASGKSNDAMAGCASEVLSDYIKGKELSVSDFSATAKQVLAKIAGVDPKDTQQLERSRITQEQLARAVQDPSFGVEEEQALAALYQSFDGLQNLSGTDKTPTPTISVSDLDQFDKNEKSNYGYVDEDHLMKASSKHIIEKFGSRDGSITRDQVEAGLQTAEKELEAELSALGKDPTALEKDLKAIGRSGGDPEKQLQAVADDLESLGKELMSSGTSRQTWEKVKSLAQDQEVLQITDCNWTDLEHVGITDGKVVNLGFDWHVHWHPTTLSKEAQTVLHVATKLEEVQQIQTAGAANKLYGKTGDPADSIVPAAVRQGRLVGDCEFLDIVSDLSVYNPGTIKDAIKQNNDGTYTVTFPAAKDDPVTVNAPTDAEIALGNRGSDYGLWVAILEKAYGKYCQTHKSTVHGDLGGGFLPQEGGNTNEFEMKVPISLWTGHQQTVYTFRANMPEVTGNPTDFIPDGVKVIRSDLEAVDGDVPKSGQAGSKNAEKMQMVANALMTALSRGKVVTTGTDIHAEDGHTDMFGKNREDRGYFSDHAYAVLGFDPVGQDGGTVTVRNPWGGPDGPRGLFKVSLYEFMRNFVFLDVENDNPITSMGDLYK